MKSMAIFIGILLAVIFTPSGYAQQDDFPVLKGPYLGQKPPGKIPVKFPFDYMPSGYSLHSAPAFMAGGDEVYFSAMDFYIRFSEKIFFMRIINGTWTSPLVAPFSGNTFDGSPSISREGRYLIFSSSNSYLFPGKAKYSGFR